MEKKDRHPSIDSNSINTDRADLGEKIKTKESESALADDWEISENSMLTDHLTEGRCLTMKELDNIIDELDEFNEKLNDIKEETPANRVNPEPEDKQPEPEQKKTEPVSEQFKTLSEISGQHKTLATSRLNKPTNSFSYSPIPKSNIHTSSTEIDALKESTNSGVHKTPRAETNTITPTPDKEEETNPSENAASEASRKAAENLIDSLTESISGTKTPSVKMKFEKTEGALTHKQKKKEDLVPSDTADFPTSQNPFKNATNSGLLEIAKSTSTSEATLLWLSENPDAAIRRAVAENTSASKKILARLTRDMDGQVRLATLDNPSLTPDLVVNLLSDFNPLVSLRAYEVLNEKRKKAGLMPITNKTKLTTVLELPALNSPSKPKPEDNNIEPPITASGAHEAIVFLRMIAKKHSTPIERLTELAGHSDTLVRAAVAQNSRSPIDVLWSLVSDPDALVKQNLIKNESTPVELLWALKDDSDKTVAKTAYRELKKFEAGL